MSIKARLLEEGDKGILNVFLKPHTPYVFSPREMLREGLRFDGRAHTADFFGAFEENNIIGILTHSWLGSVQVFAVNPAAIPELAKAFQDHRASQPRAIECFLGPWKNVEFFLSCCGVNAQSLLHEGKKKSRLLSLDLAQLKFPKARGNSDVIVRRARADDLEYLAKGRHDFFVEVNGAEAGQETFDKARNEMFRRIEERNIFVLEEKDRLISFCGVGGNVDGWTEVGPVWTPPEKRGRGYAKAIVSGALDMARREGLKHAVLFVIRPDAEKVYRDVGFAEIGEWYFDFLKKPVLSL